MALKFKVYATPNCAKCGLTIRQLTPKHTKENIEHIILGTEQDINKFKSDKGIIGGYSMPHVEVYQDGKQIDVWNDLNVERIAYYK